MNTSINPLWNRINLSSAIVIVFILFAQLSIAQNPPTPQAEKGIIDLRDWKFGKSNTVELKGEWELYWKELLYPGDFMDSQLRPIYQPIPGTWENDSLNIPAQGYATYRLQVVLNSVTPELSIYIPQLYNAYILYINGEYINSVGQVGTSEENSKAHWLNTTKNLIVTKDTLEIVLQISNFRHEKGGMMDPLILGSRGYIQSEKSKTEAFDFIMASSLFFVGLFFMVLYWFGKQEKHILYFSLFSLVFSYRLVGSFSYTLHSLYPEIPWIITFRLELITLYLGVAFFGLYSYHLYKEETSKVFIKSIVFFYVAMGLVTLFFPPLFFTQIIKYALLLLGIIAFYLYYTYVIAYLNKRLGSIISLISSTFLMVVVGHFILVYFGYTTISRSLYFIGYQQFFFLQSIILFYRYTQKLEIAKAEAEHAAKSRSDFLSMISHEIRTPLNAVIGLTNFLISDNPRKNQEEDLRTLKFSAENLHVLINDVLDYSKLDAGKIEFEYREVNIKELSSNILKGLKPKAKEQKIYLKLDYDAAIPNIILADALRVSQILTNLIGNAIKFTKKGGVTLSLKKIMGTDKKVAIKFTVEDTGIGIPKDKQKTIFESFSQAETSTTREYGGTGLGLSITKKILDFQNTQIHLFSREGQGSKFYFTQTFEISKNQELKNHTNKDAQVDLAGKKVLLVEDNPVNVMVAKKFLSRWDIDIDVAENGREALEKNVYNTYDLILMDLQMPVMDGYDASKELRVLGVKTPIIALTASVMLDVGDKVYSCGMNDYITKPFDPDDLYNKIKTHIINFQKEGI